MPDNRAEHPAVISNAFADKVSTAHCHGEGPMTPDYMDKNCDTPLAVMSNPFANKVSTAHYGSQEPMTPDKMDKNCATPSETKAFRLPNLELSPLTIHIPTILTPSDTWDQQILPKQVLQEDYTCAL